MRSTVENNVKVKPCPLCGSEVDAQFFVGETPPRENMFSDGYIVQVRFKAVCHKCYLKQDVVSTDPNVKFENVLAFIEESKEKMLRRWNTREECVSVQS